MSTDDNINQGVGTTLTNLYYDECSLTVNGVTDNFSIGSDNASTPGVNVYAVHCKINTNLGNFTMGTVGQFYGFDCDIDSSKSTTVNFTEFMGAIKFYGCDLSGCSASGTFDITNMRGGTAELWNCDMPASHTLTTGTATARYRVANYGSDNTASLGSTDSEQLLEIHTLEGTVDIETTAVRTGGADDGAAGGFSYALVPNSVADNFVGVVSPWMYIWVEGDGMGKTLTVFIANSDAESAANNIETDEAYLEVAFPSEAGDSMYDYLPDEGASGDGGGRMQLLGTPADLTTTSETWGSGGNNDQKFSQSIAPDYQGPVYCRVHYSKVSGPTLYVDAKPEIT